MRHRFRRFYFRLQRGDVLRDLIDFRLQRFQCCFFCVQGGGSPIILVFQQFIRRFVLQLFGQTFCTGFPFGNVVYQERLFTLFYFLLFLKRLELVSPLEQVFVGNKKFIQVVDEFLVKRMEELSVFFVAEGKEAVKVGQLSEMVGQQLVEQQQVSAQLFHLYFAQNRVVAAGNAMQRMYAVNMGQIVLDGFEYVQVAVFPERYRKVVLVACQVVIAFSGE